MNRDWVRALMTKKRLGRIIYLDALKLYLRRYITYSTLEARSAICTTVEYVNTRLSWILTLIFPFACLGTYILYDYVIQ